METWFTSDLHFGHANIIKYCDRPFKSVEEMNETLISNWNEVVRQNDRIFLLGDVAFMPPEESAKILDRLNGKVHLVKGNHDRTQFLELCGNKFVWVKDYHELSIARQRIVMCHFPFVTWNKAHYGSWNLHGHCHGSLADDSNSLRMDVGVDCNAYYPFHFDEIRQRMMKKKFKPVDHHGAD